MSDVLDRMHFGPLASLPSMDASAALGVPSVKVALPPRPVGATRPAGILIKLYNRSATATIAWRDVIRDADGNSINPNIDAGDVPATCGSHIGPGQTEWFVLMPDRDLYVVADAAATRWSCTSRLYQ